jgi:hypothetical protein
MNGLRASRCTRLRRDRSNASPTASTRRATVEAATPSDLPAAKKLLSRWTANKNRRSSHDVGLVFMGEDNTGTPGCRNAAKLAEGYRAVTRYLCHAHTEPSGIEPAVSAAPSARADPVGGARNPAQRPPRRRRCTKIRRSRSTSRGRRPSTSTATFTRFSDPPQPKLVLYMRCIALIDSVCLLACSRRWVPARRVCSLRRRAATSRTTRRR